MSRMPTTKRKNHPILKQKYPRLAAALSMCGLATTAITAAVTATHAHATPTQQGQANQSELEICRASTSYGGMESDSFLYTEDNDNRAIGIDMTYSFDDNVTLLSEEQHKDFILGQFKNAEFRIELDYTTDEKNVERYIYNHGHLYIPGFHIPKENGEKDEYYYKVQAIQVGDITHTFDTSIQVDQSDYIYNYYLGEPVLTDILNAWDNGQPFVIKFKMYDSSKTSSYATVANPNWAKTTQEVHADTVQIVENWKDNKCRAQTAAESMNCFFTTAAVHQVGLADDCWELTCLRNFRDTQLAQTAKGQTLISQYYNEAPQIVARINQLPNAQQIWLRTYWLGVVPSAVLAKLRLNRLATKLYTNLFLTLKNY